MDDLFTTSPKSPLAELLRPSTLSEVVGQAHLVAPGKPLHTLFLAQKIHSMVLWGPPGVGKTTIARLMAKLLNYEFVQLSAVTAGAKELRDTATFAQEALNSRRRPTLVFIDEAHRFNKAQQDLLLPYMESGLWTAVLSTTETPSFAFNDAVLSRSQVYVLEPLTSEDLHELLQRAITYKPGISLAPDTSELLVEFADGDGRRLLNLYENLHEAATTQSVVDVSLEFARGALAPNLRRFDAGGAEFYEAISALHKAVRGSHPDAALYWLARMLDGGADARYVARRLVRMASEEVGNADPRALQVTTDAAVAFERLGHPEGELALAHATVYLAVAPKSNAVYVAWNQAKAFVSKDQTRRVPIHLRNAPTKLQQDLGYKKGYRYAHDEDGAYAAGESYLPDGMDEPGWYQPVRRGLETQIADKLEQLRALDAAAAKAGHARRSESPFKNR